VKVILLLLILSSVVGVAQESSSYGVFELYYDTPSRMPVLGFSHYQPLKDSTLVWSSYTWYWARQFDSKQWVQYWVHPRIGVGVEIEMWQERALTEKPLYFIPRLGMQVRLW
jgi:hypothetical protein